MTNSGECTPTYPFDRSTFCIYFSRHWDQAQCQFNGSNGRDDIQYSLVTSAFALHTSSVLNHIWIHSRHSFLALGLTNPTIICNAVCKIMRLLTYTFCAEKYKQQQ